LPVDSYTFLRPELAQPLVVVRAEKIDSRLFPNHSGGLFI